MYFFGASETDAGMDTSSRCASESRNSLELSPPSRPKPLLLLCCAVKGSRLADTSLEDETLSVATRLRPLSAEPCEPSGDGFAGRLLHIGIGGANPVLEGVVAGGLLPHIGRGGADPTLASSQLDGAGSPHDAGFTEKRGLTSIGVSSWSPWSSCVFCTVGTGGARFAHIGRGAPPEGQQQLQADSCAAPPVLAPPLASLPLKS
mmetsp:Transcript_16686/g.35836  ORF Transcript_16686/g.35836 Transcript_16686/m.35836 type:complete len:204 (-) Transcript_16686:210-821(-)